jgi:nitroreductase
MEFFDVVDKRKSIRSFKRREIEDEKIQKILETANSAPSAGNLQSYDIVLVRDEKTKSLLVSAAYGQSFIKEAPIVFVICANEERSEHYGERGRELYCINDASIAAAYIELSATALDLGSVWVGAFDEDEVREIISAPDYVKPIAIIPIGYTNEKPKRHGRRKLSDLVHKERFKEKF